MNELVIDLKREWFFTQMRRSTEAMKKQLSEDMEGLRASIAEHQAGLEALEAADVSPHVREQFKNIIERHTQELATRESNYETATTVYDRILSFEHFEQDEHVIELAEVLALLTLILQIPDPQEGDIMDVGDTDRLRYTNGAWEFLTMPDELESAEAEEKEE